MAYANAVGGRITALAALLVVAADKVNESILVLHDSDLGAKEKTTIYECVIREALALGRATKTTPPPLRGVKRHCTLTTSESAEKRKLLLCEIELLQLFGAVAHGSCTDKKVASPLILATQVKRFFSFGLYYSTVVNFNYEDDFVDIILWYVRKAGTVFN